MGRIRRAPGGARGVDERLAVAAAFLDIVNQQNRVPDNHAADADESRSRP